MEGSSQKEIVWTRFSKGLCLLSSVLALAVIGLTAGLIVVSIQRNKADPSQNSELCLTQKCIKESANVLNMMNLTADPCDDFYVFACGGFNVDKINYLTGSKWLFWRVGILPSPSAHEATFLLAKTTTWNQATLMPDDKTQRSTFQDIDEKTTEQLRVILTEPSVINDIQPFKDAKALYQSCMNVDAIESLDMTQFDALIAEMGGWAVVLGSAWNEAVWTWEESVFKSRLYGYSVSNFLSFSVTADNRDSTRRIIRIDQAGLSLNRNYLIEGLENFYVEAYYNYQIDLAVMFGASRADAEREMLEALDFEIELAKISWDTVARRNETALYNPMTIAQLNAAYPSINWLNYLNNVLLSDTPLQSDYVVVVGAVSFFNELEALIGRTSKRAVANYAIWRIVFASIAYMPSRFRSREQDYNKLTLGRETTDPRWLECVRTITSSYQIQIGALYVRKHFTQADKANVAVMFKLIREETKEYLKATERMDESTRAAALAKLEKMTEQIAFADELLDDTAVRNYHNEYPVTVDLNEYYATVFKLNVASANRTFFRLRVPVDRNDWTAYLAPTLADAGYITLENRLKFPAAILQGVFFEADRPQHMNFGALGTVLGHEVFHAFDDRGSLYDGDGDLDNWMSPQVRTEYSKRADCIINQYSSFVEPQTGLHPNGNVTMAENMVDNIGIQVAYRAYQRWTATNTETKIAGLDDYTEKQIFWIAAAHCYCAAYRTEHLVNRLQTYPFSAGHFRVIGPRTNSEDFARDFQCAAGTKMNPVEKCAVAW